MNLFSHVFSQAFSNIKKVSILILAALVLSGCQGILDPKGMIAAAQKNLIITSVLLMLIVVLPVLFMSVYFAWRYRETNPKNTEYLPDWGHSVKLEAFMWGIPLIIIVILATITWRTSHSLDPYKPLEHETKPITIQVIALDWKWLFIYPEQNIATINYIQIPENTPINFLLTADAPMNSFWIPQLGGMIYVMSGMQTKLHLIANEQGNYDGLSSNYSGFGFSDMKFVAKASSKEEFDSWVADVQERANVLTDSTYKSLVAPTRKHEVEYYSGVDNNLFHNIMAKYMTTDAQISQSNKSHANIYYNNDPSHHRAETPVHDDSKEEEDRLHVDDHSGKPHKH